MAARPMRAALGVLLALSLAGCAARRPDSPPASLMPTHVASRTVEGPWILWSGINERYWWRHSTYETASECESQVEELTTQANMSAYAAKPAWPQRSPYILLWDDAPRFVFRCEPDAVDLRGVSK